MLTDTELHVQNQEETRQGAEEAGGSPRVLTGQTELGGAKTDLVPG